MKKHVLFSLLTVLLITVLAVPAFAASDYGYVYDDTGELAPDELAELGFEILPEFVEKYGMDLRVDILCDRSDDGAQGYAEYYYDQYEYGYGADRNGVSLTVMLESDADGYTVKEWYTYAGGESWELTTNGPMNAYHAVADYLEPDAWSGDVESDGAAAAEMIRALVSGMEDYVLAGGVGETIYDPLTGTRLVEPADLPDTDGLDADVIPDIDGEEYESSAYVRDEAYLLTDSQRDALEMRAKELSELYECGIYILTVDDFTDYGEYYDIRSFSEDYYSTMQLGWGSGRDGVMLILSMADRDAHILAYGDFANRSITDYAREEVLFDSVLDNFRENDWNGGFLDFVENAGYLLNESYKGTPVDYVYVPTTFLEAAKGSVITALIPAVIVALIVCGSFKKKMKSAAISKEAQRYISGSVLSLREDNFTYSQVFRESLHTDNDRGGGGGGGGYHGGTTVSSSGFSGSSHKF